MIPKIEFHVYGEPKGQPRPRACIRGKHAGVYDPGTAANWKLQIAIAWEKNKPADFKTLTCPVELILTVWMPRPKYHFGKHGLKQTSPSRVATKPDAENLAKAVMDQLTQCGVWHDDCLVTDLIVRKRYGQNVHPNASIQAVGATITINELEP